MHSISESVRKWMSQTNLDKCRRDGNMILVGAPEDDPFRVAGVSRPGAVYRCDPARRTAQPSLAPCSIMDFDKNKVLPTRDRRDICFVGSYKTRPRDRLGACASDLRHSYCGLGLYPSLGCT
ncbi:hypothetical protein RR46_04099 [Papilio xuthus]|uniref:Uncharacterized protein n=1 Tax=Papilio xuthus TaxID=66420 RepID=A0A194QHG0_PAPXU|nr:hypothetical protein RR46_04099 [Papilio xuthus]